MRRARSDTDCGMLRFYATAYPLRTNDFEKFSSQLHLKESILKGGLSAAAHIVFRGMEDPSRVFVDVLDWDLPTGKSEALEVFDADIALAGGERSESVILFDNAGCLAIDVPSQGRMGQPLQVFTTLRVDKSTPTAVVKKIVNDLIADEALLCIDYTAGVVLFPTDPDYDTYSMHFYCKDPDRLGVIRQRLAAVGVSVDFVAGPAVEMDIYCPGKFCSE